MPNAQDAATVTQPDGELHADRRRAPRVEWPATAELLERVSVGRDGTRASSARTVNVSLSGVLLAVTHPCPVGEQLELRFPLDPGQELSAVARVVRIDERSTQGEWLIGCEFESIAVKERCELAKFLMRHRASVIDAHARRTGRR
ncbi:MAG TPA: PilZ domain-containing protein [Gaiellales bacterium]